MTTKPVHKFHSSEAKAALLVILTAADKPLSTQELTLLALNYRRHNSPPTAIQMKDITASQTCTTGRTLRLLRDYGLVIGSRKNRRAYWQIDKNADENFKNLSKRKCDDEQ